MKEFAGKVAVVTGAASGIGRALAERCVREGMRVVLADIERDALDETASFLQAAQAAPAADARVLAVRTDVSKAAEVEALAHKTLEAFGAVHLVCNNAGVAAGSSAWESTLADWEWVMGVNLWGVIHGVRIFVPIMLAGGEEGYIVNTASMAGLVGPATTVCYDVTKHAVVALSEHLHYSLTQRGARIGTSVLCPGFVATRILDSARNRPAHLQDPPEETATNREEPAPEGPAIQQIRAALADGMPPAEVADHVFQAIREGRFYILTHPEHKEAVRLRMESIVEERKPVLTWS